ncbi:Glycine cleavage system H protein [Musa troglodytarum]|uniref:Glycine cleavage system H protein n=1 Tax=Musa troglodytarum TaxID=320322 RepID=A0A9E7EPK2_9LILI|nr:Glycine cleavage system H protein [Musa troglodytarum]
MASRVMWASRVASYLRISIFLGGFSTGEVVYVELPEVSATVAQGKGFGAVESVKATSDVNSPVSGEVVEVNSELTGSPGLGASFMGSKAFLDPTR